MYLENQKGKDGYIRVSLIITGKVQGVAFRYYARNMANQLGVYGWIRNTQEGSVELTIEGKRKNINQMIEWCKKGPKTANVENVIINTEPYKGEFVEFNIRP
jgi:acylphosphatase